MKIAYIGTFGAGHSTENHYARSFEALGHEVIRLQENHGEWWPNFEGVPDLLLYTRVYDAPEARELLQAAKAQGIPTAAVHLDIFRGLEREHQVASQSMFQVGDLFTADGDATEWYSERGIRHHWLRAGVLAAEAYDAVPSDDWYGRWDVAFVGSAPSAQVGGNYHPEWPHRFELVQHLREWYGQRFIHVGNGGDLGNNYDRPNIRGHDLNMLYASVPVIVGDTLGACRESRYWSDRAYETWGRGGFLVHPRIDALDAELGSCPMWEIGAWDELHAAIDYWLAHPDHREGMRWQVARGVRKHCTYTNRAAELLTTLGLETP